MEKTDINKEEKVINLYQSGYSLDKIAKELNLSATTASNILKRNNIEIRTKGGIYELPIEDIIRDYQNGVRIKDICIKYNVNAKTIYNYLEKYNIPRNYIYINQGLNRHYFDWMDTYDKAYFIGLLVTDGCIIHNAIQIQLKYEDHEVLNVLSSKIGNENPLYFDNRGLATLHFKSKELVEELRSYGIVPRKTFITRMPFCFSKELMAHLIRGMIDGDGWISSRGHNIGFCGANFDVVKDVRDYLVWALNVYNVAIVKTRDIYIIQWSSKRDIYTIGSYLYYNKNDCYIKRKYDNFLSIITHDNTEITS